MDWHPLYSIPSKASVTTSVKTSKDTITKAHNKDGEAGHPSTQPVSAHALNSEELRVLGEELRVLGEELRVLGEE